MMMSRKIEAIVQTTLDHLVITAPSLEVGIHYLQETLGVMPQPGGIHPRMGTHNALLKLGDSCYLEVIAIKPDEPQPERSRWFDLDKLEVDALPRLRTWVARTNDIVKAQAIAPAWFGNIEPMSRGDLSWLISIPADGSLPLNGICPALIQWLKEPHPATRLSDAGCTLLRLEAHHPQAAQLTETLERIGFEGAFSVSPLHSSEQPYVCAYIQTPNGVRKLTSQ